MKKLLIFMTLTSNVLWAANNNEFMPPSQWDLPTNFTLSETFRKSIAPDNIIITFSKKSAPFNKNHILQNQIKNYNNLKNIIENIRKEPSISLEFSNYTKNNITKNNTYDDKLLINNSITITTKINNNALATISENLNKNDFIVESIKYSISNEELNKQKNLMMIESYKKFENLAKEIQTTGNFKKYKISNFSSYDSNNNNIMPTPLVGEFEGGQNSNSQMTMFQEPTPKIISQETNVVIILE